MNDHSRRRLPSPNLPISYLRIGRWAFRRPSGPAFRYHRTGGVKTVSRGATLIELVVVFAIITLLASLSLVGIQAARESARRVGCTNHVRQFGIAFQSHLDRNGGRLPRHFSEQSDEISSPIRSHGSAWVELASELGLDSDLELLRQPDSAVAGNPLHHEVFQCPSDEVTGCSYRGCAGSGVYLRVVPSHPDMGNGAILAQERFARDIVDGLSQTVFVSERLIGDGTVREKRSMSRNDFFDASPLSRTYPFDDYVALDFDRWSTADKFNHLGILWYRGGFGHTAYSHIRPPNYRYGMFGKNGPNASRHAVCAATSQHHDGVVAGHCDGSVEFYVNSVDQFLWADLASLDDQR